MLFTGYSKKHIQVGWAQFFLPTIHNTKNIYLSICWEKKALPTLLSYFSNGTAHEKFS